MDDFGQDSGAGAWLGLLQELADSDLEFVVVGGAALALHGIPRTTLDVDIYLSLNDYSLALLLALADGRELECATPQTLETPIQYLYGQWLVFRPSDGPDILDVFLARPADFRRLRADAEPIDLSGTPCLIASVDALYNMKKSCDRDIDRADLALIDEYRRVIRESRDDA